MTNRSIAVLSTALLLMLSACGPASTAVPTRPAAAVNATTASVTSTSIAPPNTATTAPSQAPSAAPTATAIAPTATSAPTKAPAGLPSNQASPNGTIVATVAPASNNTQGQPTRIVLPTLRVDSKVIPVGWTTTIQANQLVSEWDTADFAVGFHFNSAVPGAVGNTVMSGHNNIQGSVFRELDMLKVGDKITVYAGDKMYQYIVSQAMIVPEKFASADQQQKNAQFMAPTNDNRLTLISCWPRNNNTHRVIVVAKPV